MLETRRAALDDYLQEVIGLGLGESPELLEFLNESSTVFTAEARARPRSKVVAVASAGLDKVANAARTVTGLALKPFSFALSTLLPKPREEQDPGSTAGIRFVPKQLTSLQADFPFSEFLEVRS